MNDLPPSYGRSSFGGRLVRLVVVVLTAFASLLVGLVLVLSAASGADDMSTTIAPTTTTALTSDKALATTVTLVDTITTMPTTATTAKVATTMLVTTATTAETATSEQAPTTNQIATTAPVVTRTVVTSPPPNGDVIDIYMATGQSNAKKVWSDAIENRLNELNGDQRSIVVRGRYSANQLDQWWADGPQHNFISDLVNLQNTFDALRQQGHKPRLRGFFWFQGESDATDETQMDSYATRHTAYTEQFFESMGTSNVPIAIAVVDRVPTKSGNERMRSILFELGDGPNRFAFDTRSYDRLDSVHVSDLALAELGKGMVDEFYNDFIR